MVNAESAGLDFNEDRSFQERFWVLQRIAWLCFALCVIGACLGFTGHGGPWSRAMASSAAGTVEYPRVARWEASDDLRITLPPGAGLQARIEMDAAFSDVFEMEDMQPQPARSQATAQGLRFIFDLDDAAAERRIVLHVRAMRPSLGRAMHIRIGDGAALRFAPIVLP